MIDCVNPFYNDIINIMCMLGMMVGMSESHRNSGIHTVILSMHYSEDYK